MSDANTVVTNDDKGLFWNSESSDRLYDANSLGKWLSKFFTTGVMPGDFEVTPTGGMVISVASGYANINNPNSTAFGGKVLLTESAKTFTLEQANTIYPRIDTVVIERNDNDREITIKTVTGTASANPTATAPVRTNSVYQLVIAEIFVNTGVTAISSSDITMKRANDNVCGIITGTVSNNMITYGNTDLEAGVSELADGVVYFMYE